MNACRDEDSGPIRRGVTPHPNRRRLRSVHVVPTVDAVVRSGNEAGFVGTEKPDEGRNLAGVAEAPDGDLVDDAIENLLSTASTILVSM